MYSSLHRRWHTAIDFFVGMFVLLFVWTFKHAHGESGETEIEREQASVEKITWWWALSLCHTYFPFSIFSLLIITAYMAWTALFVCMCWFWAQKHTRDYIASDTCCLLTTWCIMYTKIVWIFGATFSYLVRPFLFSFPEYATRFPLSLKA